MEKLGRNEEDDLGFQKLQLLVEGRLLLKIDLSLETLVYSEE